MKNESEKKLHSILASEIETFGLYNIFQICHVENDTSLMKERIQRIYHATFEATMIHQYFMTNFYNQEDMKTSARKQCHLK